VGLLDWMKRQRETHTAEPANEPTPHRHFTDEGTPIKQLSRSEWYPDDHGLREYRYHVGQSSLGFHGGLEVSVQGGEGPEQAAYGMREGWDFAEAYRGGQYKELRADSRPKSEPETSITREKPSKDRNVSWER
jgi:hypothetical protein